MRAATPILAELRSARDRARVEYLAAPTRLLGNTKSENKGVLTEMGVKYNIHTLEAKGESPERSHQSGQEE